MRDLREALGNSLSEEAIAELMLARAALEQKNEVIDLKDRMIVDLLQKKKALEQELEETQQALAETRPTDKGQNPYMRGVESVIEDLVTLLSKYEKLTDQGEALAERILLLLEERYGLEVLKEPPSEIDPLIHQVVDVTRGNGEVNEVVMLSKGYRIGARLLVPVKLRVIEGGTPKRQKSASAEGGRNQLVLINGGRNGGRPPQDGPKGAA